ncbi:MAG TPA: hypothetical protein VJM69_04360, partial [Dehalococcoidia bacterium]|nr:hypothetical protein [Dehalococcoidia bacterium]
MPEGYKRSFQDVLKGLLSSATGRGRKDPRREVLAAAHEKGSTAGAQWVAAEAGDSERGAGGPRHPAYEVEIVPPETSSSP